MKTTIKYLLTFSLLLGIIYLGNAQKYYQYPETAKFVGTWEWTQGDETVRIILTMQKLRSDGFGQTTYSDDIVGWHSYTKAGKVVESSMGKANTQYTTFLDAASNSTLTGGRYQYGQIVSIFFEDLTKKTKGYVKLELVAGKTDELKWKLMPAQDVVIAVPGKPAPPSGFTIPTDMVLKKVK